MNDRDMPEDYQPNDAYRSADDAAEMADRNNDAVDLAVTPVLSPSDREFIANEVDMPISLQISVTEDLVSALGKASESGFVTPFLTDNERIQLRFLFQQLGTARFVRTRMVAAIVRGLK